jgi:signal peptidase I
METTLQNSDRLLVDKLPVTFAHLSGHKYIPKRGDIIIFNQDDLPGFIGTKQLIKRVIALPGERVVVSDGSISIYNGAHPKGFKPDRSGQYTPAPITPGNIDLTIGPGQLFVCGDNRPNSEDSRAFGPINASQIVGKLSFRIFPLGKLHHY